MARLLDRLRLRLRSLFNASAIDRDLAREMRAHLEEEIAARVATGEPPAEARRAALVAFGPVAALEEQCRDTRRVRVVDNILRDLRYAMRTLARQPGVLVAAVASIALGVGANLTIFSLANSLLLSVPTAADPGALVNIRMTNGSHVSYRAWQDLNASGALSGIAGYQFEQSVNWRSGDESISLVPLLVTANFFDVLQVPIAHGRAFTGAEAQAERDPRVVVVSHGFWQRRLQEDPNVLGRALTINGRPYIVTGVLPDRFRSIAGFALAPEVYLPLSRALVPSLLEPHAAAAQLFGRLRPDQNVSGGLAALTAVVGRMAETPDPEFKAIKDFSTVGGISQTNEFRALAAFFGVLLVVSALVLAIACANVAGLLLARGLARRREIALRLALGASRGRLIQQLLTESLLLATMGAIAGAVLTIFVFIALSRIQLPLPLPLELHFLPDWRTASLALALLLMSTCVTGLAPALQATKPALFPAIRLEERRVVTGRLTMRGMLVAGQVAVSLVLLVAALLFVRSLLLATTVNVGFDVDRLLVAQISFVEGRQGSATHSSIEDIADRVRALPGVAAAAFSEGVPLTIFAGSRTGTPLAFDGRTDPVRVDYDGNEIGPGYFQAMGIRLVRGRDFTPADRYGAPKAIVINEEFARRYFPGQDPIGRRILDANHRDGGTEIVGVVSNGKYHNLAEVQDAAIYEPMLGARAPKRLVHLLIRTDGDPGAIAPVVRDAVRAADDSAALTLAPMTTALAFARLPSQMGSLLIGLLGALGTLLAMVGLFGVISFTVSRRTAEIAIRMALGASRRAVFRLVLAAAGRLILVGLLAGVLLAWLITMPLVSFLVAGVSHGDPLSFVSAVALLMLASLSAVWGPATRAMRIQPSQALKLE